MCTCVININSLWDPHIQPKFIKSFLSMFTRFTSHVRHMLEFHAYPTVNTRVKQMLDPGFCMRVLICFLMLNMQNPKFNSLYRLAWFHNADLSHLTPTLHQH